MGLGPWYRLGMTLGNALLLTAIIETGLSFNSVMHGIAEGMAYQLYGATEEGSDEPVNVVEGLKASPQWAFLIFLYVLQILLDALLWLVIICRINKHIVFVWIIITIARTWMAAYIDIKEGWSEEVDGGTGIIMILTFLWGTVLFLFKICTGIQVLIKAVKDEPQKLHPVGQGFGEIKGYYMEHMKQIAVVLLVSEIAINVHRSFNYPITAFLMEAKTHLGYHAPDEYGIHISTITLCVDAVALILVAVKSLELRRTLIGTYVITILIHFCLFVYVVIDWTNATAHPQMFNGFVFVSLTHLIYKVFILYIYLKSVL